VLATATPEWGPWSTGKNWLLHTGAALAAAGVSLATFGPVLVPLLEHAAERAGLPPAVGSGVFYVACALTGCAVLSPVVRGTSGQQKATRFANSIIDAHLADGKPNLDVVQIHR